jgi:hypothetical protein
LAEWRHPRGARLAGELIRVAIVDDHPVVGEGTAALLRQEPDLEVIGIAASLDDARSSGLFDGAQVDVLCSTSVSGPTAASPRSGRRPPPTVPRSSS